MLLIEVKNANNVEEALRIYKEENPSETNVSGDIFIANKRFCFGVITEQMEKNAINFYGVASAIHHYDWIAHYGEKIAAFEKEHPNTQVLLGAGGIKMFYIFITIRGDVANITDETVKKAFSLSVLDRR